MSVVTRNTARKNKVAPPVRLAISGGPVFPYKLDASALADGGTHASAESIRASTLTLAYGNYERGPEEAKTNTPWLPFRSKSRRKVIYDPVSADKPIAWNTFGDSFVDQEAVPRFIVIKAPHHGSATPPAHSDLTLPLRGGLPPGNPTATRVAARLESQADDETFRRFLVELPADIKFGANALLTQFDPPEMRAKRILARLEDRNDEPSSFPQDALVLKNLARRFPVVRDLFWDCFQPGSVPRLRWLAMEVLAPHDWPRLAPLVVEGVHAWDARVERAALLGGLLTARQYRVPDDLRACLLDALRTRLQTSDARALAGDDPTQTEVICHALDTFRDFAAAADLASLRRFWQSDCAFPVRLRAVECAAHIVARHAAERSVGTFFAGEAASLGQLLEHLAAVRLVAVENGTLLWRVVALLYARLGGEAAQTVKVAKAHPSLGSRMARLLGQSEEILRRYGHAAWLGQRRQKIASLRGELTAHATK